MSEQATVFVVDDDASVRDSLCWMLEAAHMHVAAYASAEDFLAQFDGECAGCLILDVRMSGMSGMELQRRLAKRGCVLPVIMLTGHGDVPMAVKAMSAGAFGFLQKPFNADVLLEHIQAALKECAQRRAIRQQQEAVAGRLAQLTPRERQVLERIMAGQANKVIADEMGIVQRTVEVHRHNVMQKMQAASVAELIQQVLTL